jgi:hypothetical protein
MTKKSPGLEGQNPKQFASLYRLRVAGVLPESWEDRLGCFRFVHEGATEPLTTLLMGRVKDQAELIGVINTLYGLHMPLISVECLDAEAEESI